MAAGHKKVEYCSGSHPKESGFRPIDLFLALALSLARGRTVGAAQVPARTHNVPTIASSPSANPLKECKRASRREAKKWKASGVPRETP